MSEPINHSTPRELASALRITGTAKKQVGVIVFLVRQSDTQDYPHGYVLDVNVAGRLHAAHLCATWQDLLTELERFGTNTRAWRATLEVTLQPAPAPSPVIHFVPGVSMPEDMLARIQGALQIAVQGGPSLFQEPEPDDDDPPIVGIDETDSPIVGIDETDSPIAVNLHMTPHSALWWQRLKEQNDGTDVGKPRFVPGGDPRYND